MGSDWRIRPSAVEVSAAAAAEAVVVDASTAQSHVEYVLDEHAGPLTPDQRRVLEAAWRNARHALKTAEDLRDVMLAETGALELVAGECDLPELLDRAVEQVWPVAFVARKRIDVRVEGHPRPAGDSFQLGRAVAALVEHAVEHAGEGTAIVIRADDETLEIEFESEDAPLDDPLGLALASAVAKLHGGALAVDAEPGRIGLTLSLGRADSPVPQAA